MMIVDEILFAARPALEAILNPNELERMHLDMVTTKDEPVMQTTSISEDLLLRDVVYDEKMWFWLHPHEEANGFTAPLHRELQDFVAESGFGWGTAKWIVSPASFLLRHFFGNLSDRQTSSRERTCHRSSSDCGVIAPWPHCGS
ncbi:hypothetical protein AS189_09595 [Arthrobacter alpinus]|uniref:Uncharacterized protein n=1 Tax=Arthrobacter alpinus TaxID=656366 RepID=A0A0S2LZP8_9MICC|nr:hypothetical protein AS189_09595 [Arthrobacter alpinus]